MGKKAAKRRAAKERAAKKQRAKMIAAEKRATKVGAINIRYAANIEECYGTAGRGAGDKVDIGREGEKREGGFSNTVAWRLAKDGGQRTSIDRKHTVAELAKELQDEKTLLRACGILLERLLLEHLPIEHIPVEHLPVKHLTSSSNTVLRNTLLLEELRYWGSTTLGQSELLITENDRHVRGSQNDKFSEDSPQSDRILTRATLHQDTSQDQDESYDHTSSGSRKTCTQLTAKPNLLWEPGQEICLAFLDGDMNQRRDVMACAKVWEKYANIHFMVVDQNKSDIRISFEGLENSSYIGTNARSVSKEEPTVLLGIKPWNQSVQVRGTILHELGHVLGFVHEHSSPNSPLEFYKEATCEHFLNTYGWNQTTTESEVLKAYKANEVHASRYDRKSIMHYHFPASLTANKVYVPETYDLSDIDKEAAARMYPFPTGTEKANDGLFSTKDLNRIQRISWELKKIIFFEVLSMQVNSLRALRVPRPSLSNCRRSGGFCRGSSSQLQLVLDFD